MRSLLFVPGDDAKKINKGLSSGADAVILDMEDSVATARKTEARAIVAEILKTHGSAQHPRLIVRVNSLRSGFLGEDLAAILPSAPPLLMLPKCEGGADLQHCGAMLGVEEAKNNLKEGNTQLLPIVTETPLGLFRLASLAGASPRLTALTWGAEDLAACVGAEHNREADGAWTNPYQLARSLALFAAANANCDAIDTVYTDFRNPNGLEAECLAARRDGFTGKMAIHPAQIEVINRIFTPDEASITHARKIIDYFAKHPDAGVVGIDGKMVDQPHRVQAARLLKRFSQTH